MSTLLDRVVSARSEFTAWGIFALMHKTPVEEVAETAIAGDRRAVGEGSTNDSPPLLERFAETPVTRSRKVRFSLSGSPPFRILMFGSSVSMFGSRISTIAFPMLVLHLDNSPFITGLVAFAVIAPSALIYMPAGVLVDRWDPWRVMLVTEFLRGLVVGSVVLFLAIPGLHINIRFLMSAMVAEEILEIFSTLADRRYLTRLMEGDNTTSRQAYVEVRSHAAVLAGRPIGPFLFAIAPLLPFLADALSFLFSVGSLVLLKKSKKPATGRPQVRRRQLTEDIGQGFSWLRKDRQALLTVILMAVTSLVAQALILMFLSAEHSKQLSTVDIGVVLAASGAGGVIGSLCPRFLPDVIRGFWLPLQMVAWSVALAFLAISGGLSVACSAGAMLILGFTGAMGNVEFGTYLVSNVADDMIAKVTGFGHMLAIGACALGPVVGGAAVQHFGVQGAVVVLFTIVVLFAFLSLLTPEIVHKSGANCQSATSAESFTQPSAVSSSEMMIDPREREGTNRLNLHDEAPVAARGSQAQSGDIDGKFLLERSVILSRQKIVDYGRQIPVGR